MNPITASKSEFAEAVLEAAASNYFLLKEVSKLPRGKNDATRNAYGRALREFHTAKNQAWAAGLSETQIQEIINAVRYA